MALSLAGGDALAGGDGPPGIVSDGVVHYDLSKIPRDPAPCVLFAKDHETFDSHGPCEGLSLDGVLGKETAKGGGLVVRFPGGHGREWRAIRLRETPGTLAASLEGVVNDAALRPQGPLSSTPIEGLPFPASGTKTFPVVPAAGSPSRFAAAIVFEVAGYRYGVLVQGDDAAAVETDLRLATSAIAVEKHAEVMRYSPLVVHSTKIAIGITVVIAITALIFGLSNRAKRRRETAAMDEIARQWKDRAG